MRHMMMALAGLLVLFALAGCGGGEPVAAAPSPKPSVSATPDRWEQVPAKDRRAFLTVLGQADPGLVRGERERERALRRADYTCRDIAQGVKGSRLVDRVAFRFTGGSGTVSKREAPAVIRALKRYVCPSL